ncbi:hypothetical protein [Novosphingobium sp. CF614]|uniref:hypothetical protein n=1 Tax=Novosphingobium sp. CF614 TaxID=1884364 RepID=UPI000B8971A6|nr:hypothetical protein [Novosphingobium sp. CF614]
MAITWASFHHGPWYDEFYTQYVTRNSIGWGEALRGSWLADNHPPLYYALARATDGLGGIETHRLLNLGIAAAALVAGMAVVREVPGLRMAAALLALLLAANSWTMLSAAELRSYFLSLCAGAVLALSLAAIWISGEAGSPARRAATAMVTLLAFNTHIITTVIAGAFYAPFVLLALARRDWRRLRALLPPALASGGLFLAVTAIQYPHWRANTQVFWIAAGFEQARWSIEYALLRTLEANPAITLGALVGGALFLRDILHAKAFSPQATVLAQLTVGAMLAIAILVGLHLLHPMLIEKYLTAMVGAVSFGLALACARLVAVLGRRAATAALALAFLVTTFALGQNVALVTARNSWFGTGELIARQVARCPGTVIHTDDFWNSDVMAMSPDDNRAVTPWAYRYVASEFGFRIEPQGSHRLGGSCPTLFWAEHDTRRRFDETTILARLRATGFDLEHIYLTRVGDGWVASDRPLVTG